jgi:hypothetical protein
VFMQDFSVESKNFGISSLRTSWQYLEAWYNSNNEVNMNPRSPRTKPVKMENSKDPDRKCRILRDKELHLNRGETDVKGLHAEGGRLQKTREATACKGGRGLGQSGPRPAGPCHFEAQSAPP